MLIARILLLTPFKTIARKSISMVGLIAGFPELPLPYSF